MIFGFRKWQPQCGVERSGFMVEKQFQKGEVIFHQGESGDVFYQIIDGSVGIFMNYGGKDEIKLTERTKDQIFGEMAVIDSTFRSADAVALTDGTKVCEISENELNSYFENNPGNVILLMKTLSGRLRDLTKDYNDAEDAVKQLSSGEEIRDEGFLKNIKKYREYFKIHRERGESSAEAVREEARSHSEGFAKNVMTCKKGTVICNEGDLVQCMYDIHWGRVGIFTNFGTSMEVQLSTLTANEFFGEMGLVDNAPRSATAVALDDDTTVETIYADDLADLFQKNPPKVDMILRDLSSKLRSLTMKYAQVCEQIAEKTSFME